MYGTCSSKPAAGFELQVPYILALVQMDEGPVLTGQVVDSPPELVRHGARVKGVFRKLGQDGEAGVIYYGTKWKVLPPEGATAPSVGSIKA